MLINHKWEGNVRELKNLVERLVIMAKSNDSDIIDIDLLPEDILDNKNRNIKEKRSPYDLNYILYEVEKKTIINAMEISEYNKSKAAKLLNIPRSTLYFKLEKYNIKDLSNYWQLMPIYRHKIKLPYYSTKVRNSNKILSILSNICYNTNVKKYTIIGDANLLTL